VPSLHWAVASPGAPAGRGDVLADSFSADLDSFAAELDSLAADFDSFAAVFVSVLVSLAALF